MRTQEHERADRVRAAQSEFFSPFERERFRHEKKSVEPIRQTQAGRDPERQPRIRVPKNSTKRGPEHEANAKSRADETERARSFFARHDIGDVSHPGGNARRRDSRNHSAEKKPADGRRQRHDDVIEAEPEIRKQDHRPPAKAVRQNAEHRRKNKLHERENRSENAEHFRRARCIAAEKIEDELRQNRRDQSDREHVERHRDENKNDGGLAWLHFCEVL